MKKKIVGKDDTKLILQQFNSLDVKIDFSEEEKTNLIKHFSEKQFNQFNLIIVKKVLSKKNFTLDNHNIITGLLATLSKVDVEKLFIKTDKDILDNANTLFKLLFVVDIEQFYNNEF